MSKAFVCDAVRRPQVVYEGALSCAGAVELAAFPPILPTKHSPGEAHKQQAALDDARCAMGADAGQGIAPVIERV